VSRHLFVALALAAGAVPSAAQAETPAKKVQPAKPTKPNPAEAMAFMSRLFDKLFPAGPEPEPARLAAAREMSFAMLPKGAYAEAMNGFTDRMADNVLGMSEADFLTLMPPTSASATKKKKAAAAAPAKPPSTEPLRVMLTKKDPMFDAKLAAGKAFAKTLFVKFGEVAEPKLREGMARSMARRFDAQQMAEIGRFLATPTGAAYGRQMVGLWFEPEVMRGAYQAFPDLMKLAPDLVKDAAALDSEMKGKSSANIRPPANIKAN
jgi:hypothetical protein